MVETHFCSDGH